MRNNTSQSQKNAIYSSGIVIYVYTWYQRQMRGGGGVSLLIQEEMRLFLSVFIFLLTKLPDFETLDVSLITHGGKGKPPYCKGRSS